MQRLARTLSAVCALIISTPAVAASVLYGLTGQNQLVTVDITTGTMTPIGSPLNYADNILIRDLAYDDNSQKLYGFDILQNRLIAIDPQTGIGTMTSFFGGVTSLAIDAEGTMYSHDSGYLTRYDSSEERFLRVGPSGIPYPIDSLTADKNTGALYTTRGDELYSLDTISGAATLIAMMIGKPEVGYKVAVFRALAFDNSNDTLYGYNSAFYAIDMITGEQTYMSHTSQPLRAIAFGSAVVPIPAAVWLFGSALGMLGWMGRRFTV